MTPPPTDEGRGFDPNSHDAMFATILARMDNQDHKLDEILAHVEKTNGRVTALEWWRDLVKAKVALVSAGISAAVATGAWIFSKLLQH